MKRTLPRRTAPVQSQPPADEIPNAVMPDPEAEDRKRNPAKYRKGLPEGKLQLVCRADNGGKPCGSVGTIFVDYPEGYTEEMKVRMFAERGWRFNPPACRFCLNRKRMRAGK